LKTKRYYSFSNYSKRQPSLRKIEIEENETLIISVKNRVTEEVKDISAFFMPGVATIEWEMGARLEAKRQGGEHG